MKGLLKEYRMPIFGISIIWIYLRHLLFIGEYDFGFLNYVFNIGDCGVDIFLFLSGYGLYFSYENNSLKEFYRRRLLRLLPSTLLLLVVFVLADTILHNNVSNLYQVISPNYYIYSLCTNYWFLFAILFFYIFFPIIKLAVDNYPKTSLFFSYILAIALVGVFSRIQVPLFADPTLTITRIPIFTIGVICAAYSNILERKWPFFVLFIMVFPLLYLDIPKDLQRLLYGFIVIGIIKITLFVISKLPHILKAFLEILGNCSLEFYLIHIYLMWNLNLFRMGNYIDSQVLVSIIIFIITFVSSYTFKKLYNRIIKL